MCAFVLIALDGRAVDMTYYFFIFFILYDLYDE